MIIAVDFDDTLQMNGKDPNMILINRLITEQRRGATLILWSCRSGERLSSAVEFCAKYGLRFNYVNENSRDAIRILKSNPRKIYADIYIDDKAARF